MKNIIGIIFISIVGLISCQKASNFYSAEDINIRYGGRIDFSNPKEPVLISSASYVEFAFEGKKCEVLLKKLNPPGEHNYVSVVIDGEYIDRLKILSDTMKSLSFNLEKEGIHQIRIYKATEASNNQIVFGGIKVEGIQELPSLPSRKIEFIGNSITCAMGAHLEDLPCGEGIWYDQHNAFWSYATQSALTLNAQFKLSSVSGIGIYRNWNGVGPVMPDVYENLYLNENANIPNDFSQFIPDLVSICLGTNDMSDGDGINERLPFDSAFYISEYIDFIGLIYDKYPNTQICLLSSPMMSKGEKRDQLFNCLTEVKVQATIKFTNNKSIEFYDISLTNPPKGCGSHPSKQDQLEMTHLLIPFYQKIMDWE